MPSKAEDVAWITKPVHGNSKRLCEIKRSGQPCGSRATHETYAKSSPNTIYVFHCQDNRHVANARKQITEQAKKA